MTTTLTTTRTLHLVDIENLVGDPKAPAELAATPAPIRSDAAIAVTSTAAMTGRCRAAMPRTPRSTARDLTRTPLPSSPSHRNDGLGSRIGASAG